MSDIENLTVVIAARANNQEAVKDWLKRNSTAIAAGNLDQILKRLVEVSTGEILSDVFEAAKHRVVQGALDDAILTRIKDATGEDLKTVLEAESTRQKRDNSFDCLVQRIESESGKDFPVLLEALEKEIKIQSPKITGCISGLVKTALAANDKDKLGVLSGNKHVRNLIENLYGDLALTEIEKSAFEATQTQAPEKAKEKGKGEEAKKGWGKK